MRDLLGEPPADLHPDLDAFLDWLDRLRRPGETIVRAEDVDLMQMWRLAPRIEIADVLRYADGSHRYRWRFAGSAVREAWGAETTWRHLDETDVRASAAELDVWYRRVIETGRPHYARRRIASAGADRAFMTYERIVAPLAAADGQVVRLIVGNVFDPLRGRRGR